MRDIFLRCDNVSQFDCFPVHVLHATCKTRTPPLPKFVLAESIDFPDTEYTDLSYVDVCFDVYIKM
jgi:hypothetical protein